MRIEDSKYKSQYEKKVSLPSGNYYFFKKFVVAEINEGIHFNWDVAEVVVKKAYEHYGENLKVAYISNRVNDYTISPQDWLNFYRERHRLEAFAIVAYNKKGLMAVVLEKIFSQSMLQKFNSLDKAVNWVLTLKKEEKLNQAK
ncbi:hypothetical protein [Cochleicola gelatinilyticus]|uniref:STAS/SEC14 domain-containing protein n=1 Tax=Cochleicola gelatinilyticus TaxID=1763537 RepID=A0A167GYZ7_9FLAO|nr:hypothetical protein [Cochleicola gelatinilyticus]OAB78047.1 hypothetical protein ULVI_11220 [Cochleicola gelatinilyticus]